MSVLSWNTARITAHAGSSPAREHQPAARPRRQGRSRVTTVLVPIGCRRQKVRPDFAPRSASSSGKAGIGAVKRIKPRLRRIDGWLGGAVAHAANDSHSGGQHQARSLEEWELVDKRRVRRGPLKSAACPGPNCRVPRRPAGGRRRPACAPRAAVPAAAPGAGPRPRPCRRAP